MADSNEPKKYPPSAKKLMDLRKKGQFPKSTMVEPNVELITFVVLFTLFIYWVFSYGQNYFELVIYLNVVAIWTLMKDSMINALLVMLIMKMVLSSFYWVGINKSTISMEPLSFNINKLNPVEGFKNNFGIDALSKSIMHAFEFGILLFVINYVLQLNVLHLDVLYSINNKESVVYNLLYMVIVTSTIFLMCGVVITILDYSIELFQFKKKNKMTFTEMKNELKETEGSAEIKSERKTKMREIMEQPITKNRKPTFALVNPDHILIPIYYDKEIDKLPYIPNIYTDFLAVEKRELLRKSGVPIIQSIPLAWTIYRLMNKNFSKHGEYIPKELYQHVAIILVKLREYEKSKKEAKAYK